MCSFKTSISFVDSICEIFGGLLKGIPTAVFPQPQNTVSGPILYFGQLPQFLRLHKVTRLTIVPSVLRLLLSLQRRGSLESSSSKTSWLASQLESLSMLVISGELLSVNLLQRACNILPVILLFAIYLH